MNDGICLHTLKGSDIWQKSSDCLLELLGTYKKNKVLLLLSGGSVVGIYNRIKNSELGIKNKNLAIAQIDERFFGKEQRTKNIEQINAEVIRKTGLWDVCEEKKIPYYLISQEGTLEEAAEKYDQTISKLFKEYTYKIAVLGIGEDGHTAGLLPGYEKIWNKESYLVGYDLGQNNPRGLFCQKNIKQRVTMTSNALLRLDYAIVAAAGEKKSRAIEQVLDPINVNNLNKYPAAIIQKIKKVDLFTDII